MNIRIILTSVFLLSPTLIATTMLGGCTSTPYRKSGGEFLDSSAITAKVKSALLADNEVKGFSINVVTFKDQVELSGFVDTEHQKQKAIYIAQRIQGVKAVIDKMVVKTQLYRR